MTLRYLFGTDRRAGRIRGAIIAIAVSLVPLIVVLEVADGMIEGITARAIEVGTYHLQAIAVASVDPAGVKKAANIISTLPGVTGAYPERQGLGLISSATARTSATIRAIDPSIYVKDSGFHAYLTMRSGTFDLQGTDSILLGTEIASTLHAGVGDTVRIITVRSFGGAGFLPRVSTFHVRGIFTTGYEELDATWVFIPYDGGVQILPADSSRQIVGVKVNDPFALPNPLGHAAAGSPLANAAVSKSVSPGIVGTIVDLLGSDWRVLTWYDLAESQYQSFLTTKNLLIFIMILIVLVASINISSAMLMLIMEKRPEIAILKSMGASPAGIRRTFLFIGFAAGCAGTVIGVGFGLFLAVNINEIISGLQIVVNALLRAARWVASPFGPSSAVKVDILSPQFYLDVIPIRISLTDVTATALLSMLLTTAATYIPARKAGATRPLEVMRKH